METKNLTCICCPLGCALTVLMEGNEVIQVTGNTCKRGETYGYKEVTNPTRVVTSSVRVTGGTEKMVSVKTKEDIPKDKIFECIRSLKDVTVHAPVQIGDIILADAAGTGVDIAATKNIAAGGEAMLKKPSKELDLTNMNGVTEDKKKICGLNDMNCAGSEDVESCGLNDMNCVDDKKLTCGLNDMNCSGE